MSTSDMNNKRHGLRKTIIAYLILSAACVCVANVYALFGHGIRSAAMDFMFLYPLLGGGLVYCLIALLFPRLNLRRHYRLACNLYNSGIAALTVGALLKGIVEIAGTGSAWSSLFAYAGIGFLAAAVLAVSIP